VANFVSSIVPKEGHEYYFKNQVARDARLERFPSLDSNTKDLIQLKNHSQ
jgi:hypothetical protein